jgi:hypothetical protein
MDPASYGGPPFHIASDELQVVDVAPQEGLETVLVLGAEVLMDQYPATA